MKLQESLSESGLAALALAGTSEKKKWRGREFIRRGKRILEPQTSAGVCGPARRGEQQTVSSCNTSQKRKQSWML
jgi:hypothetical protein